MHPPTDAGALASIVGQDGAPFALKLLRSRTDALSELLFEAFSARIFTSAANEFVGSAD
jgi:hypothetical protein